LLLLTINHAALDESNINYFLSTETGRDEISSLSLSFNMIMCRGALMSGHKQVSIEYFNKADQQLMALMYEPEMLRDYSVALVISMMVWQTINLQVKMNRMNEYLRLDVEICKSINALNSDVTSRYEGRKKTKRTLINLNNP
jgi:hypothetical protein